jgi:hypothetical protein
MKSRRIYRGNSDVAARQRRSIILYILASTAATLRWYPPDTIA